MRKYTLILLLLVTLSGYSQLNTDNAILTGRSRLYFGNYTGAIQSFNMVIRIKPFLPEPYFYRGVAKLELDDFRGAKKDLDKAIEIKPFFPEAIMYRGVVNYNLKEYALAMADYSRSMELDGENADIYNNIGICKAAMRDFEGAIQDYTKAIESKPKNFNAYLNRSIAYQVQKEWDKAIADCNQLIRIRPNSPMGYLSRGLIKVEKQDFASAMRDFDMSIYLDPQNAFAYMNRGIIKQQLESLESAIMDYDTALKLDPYMANAYFNRGLAKETLGKEGYQKDYDNASLLDPRFEKRPWQTPEERKVAQQQQMQVWQQQAQQRQAKASGQNFEEQIDSSAIKSTNRKEINIEELQKRKAKATIVLEENKNDDEGGRVQNTNTEIQLLPNFFISNIDKKKAENEDVGYFNLTIENLNAQNNYNPYLTITNNTNQTNSSTEFYKNQILIFDEKIRQNDKIGDNYLYRGIFKALTNNFNDAISDFDKAIKIDEKNLLSYFMRANTKAKMIETIENLKAQHENIGLINKVEKSDSKKSNEAYDDILTDYSVILYMNPSFYFGYFNRGNIYCKNEKYYSAIDEYDKALSIDQEFAEAYYNRGLVKILLNDIEAGGKDLSRAGELGISEAYNVIKRYCND